MTGWLFIPRLTLGTGATHLPAAPYSSQGGEPKTGGKFPSDAGAFSPRGGGVSRSDGVGSLKKNSVILGLDPRTQVNISYNRLFKLSYKSRHSGLYFSIKSFFQFRCQNFNLFSCFMASLTSSNRSK